MVSLSRRNARVRWRNVNDVPELKYPEYPRPTQVVRYKHKCLRCGKGFESQFHEPARCGKCKSPYWNKPRKKAVK